jgi:hypothetical protein
MSLVEMPALQQFVTMRAPLQILHLLWDQIRQYTPRRGLIRQRQMSPQRQPVRQELIRQRQVKLRAVTLVN